MWIPVIGVLIGVTLGIILPLQTTAEAGPLVAVIILSSIYALLHAMKEAKGEKQNGLKIFVCYSVNTIVATLLTLLGKRLNISIYLAPVLFFGIGIFQDINEIVQCYLEKFENKG